MLSLFASAGVYVPSWLHSIDLVWEFQLRFVMTGRLDLLLSPLSPIVIILCTLILLLGVKEYSFMNIVITILNVGIIIATIGFGAWNFDRMKWSNFMGPGVSMGTFEGIMDGKVPFLRAHFL